jgi:hypothetical protein
MRAGGTAVKTPSGRAGWPPYPLFAPAELHGQGLGLSAIAREMNRRGIKTARGRQWEPATVRLYVSNHLRPQNAH